MMRAILIWLGTALVGSALLFATGLAQAQTPPGCGMRAELVEILKQKWDEELVAVGVVQGGDLLIEVFATDDGSTFTVLVSSPNGRSCELESGTDWQSLSTSGTGA